LQRRIIGNDHRLPRQEESHDGADMALH
jgi:hypothetical protein